MRHRLGILALLGLACLVAAATATGDQVRKGDLRLTFDAGFSPRALPRTQPAPVTIEFESAISTAGGRRPPALRKFELQLNRNGRISTHGLPTCRPSQLQSVSTERALAICRSALVGHGGFDAALAGAGEQDVPVHGQALVFNARRAGRPALLLHLYARGPVPAGFVLPLPIQHRVGRQLGTVLAAEVPVLAGGLGSITGLRLEIGRRYRFHGQRRSYLSASCAAPPGFRSAFFPFVRGGFVFRDGRRVSTSLQEGECRVREPSPRQQR